jgi:hypothetical protein
MIGNRDSLTWVGISRSDRRISLRISSISAGTAFSAPMPAFGRSRRHYLKEKGFVVQRTINGFSYLERHVDEIERRKFRFRSHRPLTRRRVPRAYQE